MVIIQEYTIHIFILKWTILFSLFNQENEEAGFI